MKKININGTEFIKLKTLREEIRHLRKDIPLLYGRYSESEQAMVQLAYNDIIKVLYREELDAAKTPEDVEAIMEMPGDFIVFKSEGQGLERKFIYFAGYENHEPCVTNDREKVLWFAYESMAREIRGRLGEGWIVADMSEVEQERSQRLLDAIFGGIENLPTKQQSDEDAE